MQTMKDLKNIVKEGKEGTLQKLLTRLIENGHWDWVRWVSCLFTIKRHNLLKESKLRDLIIKHLNTLKDIRLEQLKDLLTNVVSHLISVVAVSVMLIYSLLLLTLLLASYVVGHLLRLSHTGLMYIRTKLFTGYVPSKE